MTNQAPLFPPIGQITQLTTPAPVPPTAAMTADYKDLEQYQRRADYDNLRGAELLWKFEV